MFPYCAGLVSESVPLNVCGVQTVYPWVCDCKAYSYQWILHNGPKTDHHFADMCSLAKTGSGFCYRCNKSHAAVVPQGLVHKTGVCGFSCKPFSTAMVDRLSKGSAGHEDVGLWEAWIEEIVRLDLDEAWSENVMGIAIRESRQNP